MTTPEARAQIQKARTELLALQHTAELYADTALQEEISRLVSILDLYERKDND